MDSGQCKGLDESFFQVVLCCEQTTSNGINVVVLVSVFFCQDHETLQEDLTFQYLKDLVHNLCFRLNDHS